MKFIAVAASGGMETLKPALQLIYMTRASAYRDVVKSFIHGWPRRHPAGHGEKRDFKSEHQSDMPSKCNLLNIFCNRQHMLGSSSTPTNEASS